jgi:hypothetical protein
MKLPVVDKLLVLILLLIVTSVTSAHARNDPKGGGGHGGGSRISSRGARGGAPRGHSQSNVARAGHIRSPGGGSAHRTVSRSSGYRSHTASAESATQRSAPASGSRRATTNEGRMPTAGHSPGQHVAGNYTATPVQKSGQAN